MKRCTVKGCNRHVRGPAWAVCESCLNRLLRIGVQANGKGPLL